MIYQPLYVLVLQHSLASVFSGSSKHVLGAKHDQDLNLGTND